MAVEVVVPSLLDADELDRDEVDPGDDGEREESLDESEDGLQSRTDESQRTGDRTSEHHPAQRRQEALGAVEYGVVAEEPAQTCGRCGQRPERDNREKHVD